MLTRSSRPIAAIVGIAFITLVLPPGAVGRSAALAPAGMAEASAVAPVTIRNRATVAPLPAYLVRPFAIAAVTIQTLPWADLPMNGNAILSLKIAAGADADGIVYKVIDGRRVYSPGNLGSDGIRYVDAYVRTGDPAYLDRAVVRAAKLVSMSRLARGARWYPYLYDYAAEKLRAPWYSAYSQGFALSLFVRLYRVTGVQAWADRARETAMSFRRLGRADHPWVSYVLNSRLWLEEYPSATPTHVLNGFNFAVFGLYDYERLTRDPVARELLRGALRTIRSFGTTYRVPGGVSLYDLVHRTRIVRYHLIHIWQLRDLTLISGDPWYAALAGRLWEDYH